MTTAGNPAAPTTTEPRTPTPYKAIGAGTLSVAALLIITLSAIVGPNPEPATVRLALTVAILLLAGGGSWALNLHQHRLAEARAVVRADLAEQRAAARHEEIRHDLREVGILIHRNSGKRDLQDMGIVLEQTVDRLDRIVVMRKEADAKAAELWLRVADLERAIAEVTSPNVISFQSAQDVVALQRQRDDEQR